MEEQGFIESRDEMEELLREEEIGYLGLTLDGKPYVVPLNYYYSLPGSIPRSLLRSVCFLDGDTP